MPWDPHAHFRDGKKRYEGTIAAGIRLALSQGLDGSFDMPNNDPPTIDEGGILERLAFVPRGLEPHYRLYVGITSIVEQIAEAVRCYNKFWQVIGLKMFAGTSVGDLSVIEEVLQKLVYQTLAKLGYKGVLAVHCEMESLLRPAIWDPADPITHCSARPKLAEIESVRTQVRLASDAEFRGILHICHVSCPESIEVIEEGRRWGMRITCEVTPHHILWDRSKMLRRDGKLWKMNPPLRSREDVAALRRLLVNGQISWIGTDHAPHLRRQRLGPPYLSGYPSLRLYRDFVEKYLPSLGMSPALIQAMTDGNIRAAFADKL